MKCEEVMELLMGYLDEEIDEKARAGVAEHLESCDKCHEEAEAYRRLNKMTDSLEFIEPTEAEWRAYWHSIYNRLERGIAWIFISIGAMLIVGYGSFVALRDFLLSDEYPAVLRLGVAAATAGGIVLAVSVVRERLRILRVDRYREVEL